MSSSSSSLRRRPPQSEDQSIAAASNAHKIWSYYLQQLDRVQDLERSLDERVVRARRRIANVLDQTLSWRRSHVRLFVTHTDDYTLVLEGKLLIGLKDHASAAKVDVEGPWGAAKTIQNGRVVAKVPRTDLEAPARSKDYKTVGEREEDPIEPVQFTHLWERLEVDFQTIWKPIHNENAAASLSPPKKSRKRGKADTPTVELTETPVDPKDLVASPPTHLTWTRAKTEDAHAFWCRCTPTPSPPSPDMVFHSVVATIRLFPHRPETLYQPSALLARRFFPNHVALNQAVTRLETENNNEETTAKRPIPVENHIQVPHLFTLQELLEAFFTYIQDRKLQDPTDRSLVVCDKLLTELFQVESFSFSQLQQLLLSQSLALVTPSQEPILLTYCMTPSNASSQDPLDEQPPVHGQLLSFDTHVYVANYFHYRARELLRRLKRREFEYTSSRTKARYMLVGARGDEDVVKTQLDLAVTGAQVEPVVAWALAKAAPPHSEARGSGQADAKLAALLERLETVSEATEAAWELVERLWLLTKDENGGASAASAAAAMKTT